MKSIGKVLLVVVLLGLAVLVGHGVYVYLLPRWVAILFFTYLLMGVAIVGFGAKIVVAELKNPGTGRAKYPRDLGKVSQSSGLAARFQRIRDVVALSLRTVASAIVWPVETAFGVLISYKNAGKKMSAEELGIRQKSALPEYWYSLYTLAAVIAAFGLEYLGVNPGKYGTAILLLLIASCSLRHILYSVDTTPLPANLRRSSTNPYAAFLLMVAADFSTLVLALTAVTTAAPVSQVTFSELRTTGNQLIQAEDTLWKVLKGAQLTIDEIVIGVIGLLFYLALVKILLEYKEFRRTDQDYVWLASAACRLGNFAVALRYLRNLKSWSTDAYSTEVLALLGVNQLDQAEKQARLALEHEHKGASPEEIFGTMWQGYLVAPVSEDVGVALLQRALDLTVRDAFVQDCVLVDPSPRIQKSAIDLFSTQKDAYPLTLARLKAVSGDREGALEILNQTKPALPLDEISLLVLRATVIAADPATTAEQDVQSFRDWAVQNLPRIRVLMKQALQPWEEVLVFSELQRALLLARHLAPERVEELIYLGDSVKASTEGVAAERGFKLAELLYTRAAASS